MMRAADCFKSSLRCMRLSVSTSRASLDCSAGNSSRNLGPVAAPFSPPPVQLHQRCQPSGSSVRRTRFRLPAETRAHKPTNKAPCQDPQTLLRAHRRYNKQRNTRLCGALLHAPLRPPLARPHCAAPTTHGTGGAGEPTMRTPTAGYTGRTSARPPAGQNVSQGKAQISKPTVARCRGFGAHRLSYPHALPRLTRGLTRQRKKMKRG